MRKVVSAALAVTMLGAVAGNALAQGSGSGASGASGGVNEPNPTKQNNDTRHPNERSK
jgi:hypothetical protein